MKIQLDDTGSVLELLHALIGDARQREIEIRKLRQLGDIAKIGVRDPTATQIKPGDAASGVANDFAAHVVDPLQVGRCVGLGEQRRCKQETKVSHYLLL